MGRQIAESHIVDLSATVQPARVARTVGVSGSLISQMLSDGRLGDVKTNGEAILAYIERIKKNGSSTARRQAEPPEGGLDPQQQKALLDRERRIKLEIENAKLRRELAPVSVYEPVTARVASVIADNFDLLELRTQQLGDEVTPRMLQVVQSMHADTRNAIARSFDSMGALLDEEIERSFDGDNADDAEDEEE